MKDNFQKEINRFNIQDISTVLYCYYHINQRTKTTNLYLHEFDKILQNFFDKMLNSLNSQSTQEDTKKLNKILTSVVIVMRHFLIDSNRLVNMMLSIIKNNIEITSKPH